VTGPKAITLLEVIRLITPGFTREIWGAGFAPSMLSKSALVIIPLVSRKKFETMGDHRVASRSGIVPKEAG
jgi:hypothetical protein